MRAMTRPIGICALALACSGCAVITVAGAAAGAAISVAGTVVSTGVSLTGKVIGKAVDAVTPSPKEVPAKDAAK
jgi:hypothetical protein